MVAVVLVLLLCAGIVPGILQQLIGNMYSVSGQHQAAEACSLPNVIAALDQDQHNSA
jgi:hypothetical protein